MTSSSFPDINVWLALLLADHVHREIALAWWNTNYDDRIYFNRFTQLGVLRLLTTSAAMNGKPLNMQQAWAAYDRLFKDDRVVFAREPAYVEMTFRKIAATSLASPKLWADAWLVAFADQSSSVVVTFDQGLKKKFKRCLLLAGNKAH